jgi:hypothetical protein
MTIDEQVPASAAGGDDNSVATKQAKPRRRHLVLVSLLLVLGTILTPITMVALYVRTQVNDTGRYVSTVAPLASNPAIQAYVADDITNRLFAEVDVESYVKSVLPPVADPIAAPISTALQTFVHTTVLKIVQSQQFYNLWVAANRLAHSSLVKVLTGSGSGVVTSKNGVVTLDLSGLLTQVQQALAQSGLTIFSRIPIAKLSAQIPLFQSKDLYKIRHGVGAFNKIAFVLPFVVIALFGGAIFLSRNRRKGFLAAAIGFAIGALILAIGLTIGRSLYLNAATSADLPHDAAAAAFDTMIRLLHKSVRAALTLSVIVIIAVFFAGPSRLANWFRGRVRAGANWLGKASDDAGWTWLSPKGFVVRTKPQLRIATAAIAFAVLVLWDRPTGFVVFWTAVIVLAILVLIEFFGREPLPPSAPAATTTTAATA